MRFIPTGVGNTTSPCFRCRPRTVHPHGCGEHRRQPVGRRPRFGSSPRVWGPRGGNLAEGHVVRFIPTGVGNTGGCPRWRRLLPVHPHGCGEHDVPTIVGSPATGSSPRVWGTRHRHLFNSGNGRFIPTGVGNTAASAISRACSRFIPTHVRNARLFGRMFAPGLTSPHAHAWGRAIIPLDSSSRPVHSSARAEPLCAISSPKRAQ